MTARALTALLVALLLVSACAEDEGGGTLSQQDTAQGDTQGDAQADTGGTTNADASTGDDAQSDMSADADDTQDPPDTSPTDTPDPTDGQDTTDSQDTTAADADTHTADGQDTTDTTDADITDPPDDTCPPPPDDLPTLTATREGRFVRVAGFPGVDGLSARDLTLYLPATYDADPDARFPVLYMHDGQNLYHDADAAFGRAWEVDDTLDALVSAGKVPPYIVVGVHNTADRINDYTPSFDPSMEAGGQGAAYMDLLAHRIKPYIDAHYKTRCGPQNTALAGSSLGGLISLHQAMTTPGVFGRVAAVSPSLWWNEAETLSTFAAFDGPLPQRLWLDAGSEEGGDVGAGLRSVATNSRAALRVALDRGATFGDSVAYMEHIWAAHNEAAWEQRLPAILGYLLSDGPVTTLPVTDLWVHVHAPVIPTGDPSAVAVNTQYDDTIWLTTFADDPALTLTGPAAPTPDGHLSSPSEGLAAALITRAPLAAGAPLLIDNDDEPATAAVVFSISTPPNTQGPLYAIGSDPALGAWDQSPGLPLTHLGGPYWAGLATLPRGVAFAYKYTRGSWATVEKGPQGEELANRTFTPDGPAVLRDAVARWAQ